MAFSKFGDSMILDREIRSPDVDIYDCFTRYHTELRLMRELAGALSPPAKNISYCGGYLEESSVSGRYLENTSAAYAVVAAVPASSAAIVVRLAIPSAP